MIKEIIHVGLTVSDLDRSISFYRDILGLKFQGQLLMEGEATDKLFQKKDCQVKIAYLNGSDILNAPPVELIQFVEKKDTLFSNASLFKTSISEICFLVTDIDAEYTRLKNLGVEFLSEPQFFDFTDAGFGKSKAVYFKDPDGIILELMEIIP